jgi:hypothetical protein
MTQRKKIKDNLFIEGENVISYETVVAKIDGKHLVELGKFSSTTSKHIKKVAELYDLTIVPSFDRPKFEKLSYGTKI